jgi:hypothetical protein
MALMGFCIFNREASKTAKKIFLAHLAAEQSDSVMDREEVAYSSKTKLSMGSIPSIEPS